MSKIPEDEKVGPFFIRARAAKGIWTSIVIDKDQIASRFEGFDAEAPALEAARAYATEQAALRKPPPRGATRRAAVSDERRSMDELRAKFVKHFPKGFSDPGYVEQERGYKDKARADLLAAVTADAALSADAAQCAAARAAFSTNMLSPFENARVRQALQGVDGPAFLRGSAMLARGDAKEGLAAIDAAVRPYGAPSWTIATYLPFLWAPETNILLRISATQRVANWLGHEFVATYTPRLESAGYEALQAFAAYVRDAITDMSPRDMIDVQGFIWVVSEYK